MNTTNRGFDWKAVAILFLSFISYGWSLSAAAYCTVVNGWQNKTFNIAIPALTIPSDTPIGKTIYSQTVVYPQQALATNCANGKRTELYVWYRNDWIADDYSGLAATNVDGISIKITGNKNGQPYQLYKAANRIALLEVWYPASSNNITLPPQSGFTVEIVKTGPTSTGTLRTGLLAGLNLENQNWLANIYITNGGSFSTPSCTVTTPSVTVPMGDVKRSDFSGIGSAPVSKAFNIYMDCNASTNVKMTLTANADSSQAPGVIATDSTGASPVAAGVGIQLLFNNNPVNLGAPLDVGSYTAGYNQIGFVARYYQTKSTIKAGKANGSATFTLSYN